MSLSSAHRNRAADRECNGQTNDAILLVVLIPAVAIKCAGDRKHAPRILASQLIWDAGSALSQCTHFSFVQILVRNKLSTNCPFGRESGVTLCCRRARQLRPECSFHCFMIWHKIFRHKTRRHDRMNGQFSRGMTSHHRVECTTQRSWVEFHRSLTQGGLSTIKALISSANQSDMGIDRDVLMRSQSLSGEE
jgi:hypothetical protein